MVSFVLVPFRRHDPERGGGGGAFDRAASVLHLAVRNGHATDVRRVLAVARSTAEAEAERGGDKFAGGGGRRSLGGSRHRSLERPKATTMLPTRTKAVKTTLSNGGCRASYDCVSCAWVECIGNIH